MAVENTENLVKVWSSGQHASVVVAESDIDFSVNDTYVDHTLGADRNIYQDSNMRGNISTIAGTSNDGGLERSNKMFQEEISCFLQDYMLPKVFIHNLPALEERMVRQ